MEKQIVEAIKEVNGASKRILESNRSHDYKMGVVEATQFLRSILYRLLDDLNEQ